MKAWEEYKATPEFGNSKQWAAHPEHLLGSLWAVFHAGWNAGTAAAFGMEVISSGAQEVMLPPTDAAGVAPTGDTDLLRKALERLEWWERGFGDPKEDPPDAVIAALRTRLDGVAIPQGDKP